MGVATALAVAGGAQILGGVIGNIASSGDRQRAQDAYQRALAEIESIGAPPDLAKEIFFKNFEQVGVLTPEMEEAVHLDAPKIAQIKEAPELRKAQMVALQQLGKRAATGRSMEDEAALARIQTQQARDTEAKRQQILQSYQQRGMGGAGSELAAQLQAASAGSAQAGEQGLQLAAQAQRSALEAAREYGALGGQMRTQEFEMARTKAGAEDQAALARFNEAVARQQRNVAARTQAQQYNLGTQQRIAEANINQRNQELLRQRNAQAQQYQLGLQRAQARAGAQQGMGGQYQQQAGQTAGMWSGIGAGAGRMIGAAYSGAGKGTTTPPSMDETGYDYGSGQEGAGGGGDYRMNRGEF